MGIDLEDAIEWLPSPERSDRRTWSDTFHQGTRHRDFVSGIRPSLLGGGSQFEVQRGILLQAADHALTPEGASLVIVDEINRGPAVAVFGSLIGAMERDKRLGADGSPTTQTVSFRALNSDGVHENYSLPYHLYIVAAMNEADTSTEPLDVAFRRRFHPVRLEPDEAVLRAYFSLSLEGTSPPTLAAEASHIYEAAIRAWSRVNRVLEIARGREFQIGHGIFMDVSDPPADLDGARNYAVAVWNRLLGHVGELFFGDTRGMIEVLRAGPGEPIRSGGTRICRDPGGASCHADHYRPRSDLLGVAPCSRLLRQRTNDYLPTTQRRGVRTCV